MIYNHDTNIVTLTFFQLIEKHVWVLLKDRSNAHWDYLKYKHNVIGFKSSTLSIYLGVIQMEPLCTVFQ